MCLVAVLVEAEHGESLPSFIVDANMWDHTFDELNAKLLMGNWDPVELKVVLHCWFPLVFGLVILDLVPPISVVGINLL